MALPVGPQTVLHVETAPETLAEVCDLLQELSIQDLSLCTFGSTSTL